jgi:type II secretory pathway component HofQ
MDAPGQQAAGDTAGNTAHQLAQQAQQQAGHLADQAREQITLQLSNQKQRATSGLDSVARAIRETGRQMQGDGQAPITQAADRAAAQVERVSSFLSQRDVNALHDEAARFARRQTPLFLAGAFAVGWLGARFLKSSAPAETSSRPTYTPSGNLPAAYTTPS